MEIKVTAKSVYGETKFYPANHAADCLALIAGTKTLTRQTISSASQMGLTIVLDEPATIAAMMQWNGYSKEGAHHAYNTLPQPHAWSEKRAA